MKTTSKSKMVVDKMLDTFSDLIGVPQSLKSTLVASVRDNANFESIKNLIFDNPEGYVKELFIILPSHYAPETFKMWKLRLDFVEI